jgi:ATP-dependent DNA ligase
MSARLTQERFVGPEWIFERKLDGIRLIAFKDGAEVRLYSRSRKLQHVPSIREAVAGLPARQVILDGEMTWEGVEYHIFDVLWLDGRALTALPLEQRQEKLRALPLAPPLFRVEALEDPEPWERARREGWEGVIAKRRGSPYEHRRSPHWLKMKCEITADLVIGGFTEPKGKRIGLGALLLGCYDQGELVFAGKVGTGLDNRQLADLRSLLAAAEISAPPFTRGVGLPRRDAHWVRPEIVARVAFIEWTAHRKLRHPRLLEIRGAVPPEAAIWTKR